MSWISATDPLALLAIQAGQVGTPATEAGAAASRKLDAPQRAIELGEPVPIVFCRRRNSKGGVLVSPGATEARFENDATNSVTAYYHLVLSEGQIDSIPVKDVFQRSCRVGSHTQTYNRRAGTWTPGNAILARAGYDMPECPYYCGSVGAYTGMSTLSFQVTIPNGFDQWNRQVHAFIRGGMRVTRLQDGVTGASDSFADLIRWAWVNSSRVPSALIDTTTLSVADDFLEANGFTCNCWITNSQNVGDVLAKWAPYFLLGESNIGGKKGLQPLLPINVDGTIKTGPISWEYEFTENTIIPDSLEISYSSYADRLPFVAQVTWRQQLEDDFGIIRTAEVRYSGTAASGPYESHDLSEFCTNEAHAVKVGAYILSKRINTTHTIRFVARPEAHNTILTQGDIIRVKLARNASGYSLTHHDYLYQVERITKTLAGDVSYECSHFPVDDTGASLVALDVAAATGTGVLLTSNKTGVGCDVNSSTDNTIPAETWSAVDSTVAAGGVTTDLTQPIEDDPLQILSPIPTPSTSFTGPSAPVVGDTLSVPSICEGGYVQWYREDKATGVRTPAGQSSPEGWTLGTQFSITTSDIGYWLQGEMVCPLPGQGGLLGEVGPVTVFDPSAYTWVRWLGTTSYWQSGSYVTSSVTTRWFGINAGAYVMQLYCSPGVGGSPTGLQGAWKSGVTTSIPAGSVNGTVISLYMTTSGGVVSETLALVSTNGPPQPPGGGGAGGVTGAASGSWQFSNDKTTILKTWAGNA
jgi:hypothetical protein